MIRSFKKHMGAWVTVGPTVVWLGIFLFLPLVYVILITFLTKNAYGGVDFIFTLDNYKNLFNSEYLKVFWDSILLSFETTVICLLAGYPFAYILANAPKRWKSFLVLLLMLPFWTNSLIRTYGWNTLLRTEGIINHLLLGIGLIKEPLEMLYTNQAVLLGMVYALLPFAVLPLYTSIEKLDKSLLEAGSDLGASRVHVFTRIVLPLTMPGIFAGSIQTFIPSLGFFFISDMMGGAKTMYIGNLIKNQFLSARNWPFGAALSIVLIVITLVLMRLYTRVGSLEDMA